MGFAFGEVGGREVGYGVDAICEHPFGCDNQIDRGLAYACGDWPIGHEVGGNCQRFVCYLHQYSAPEVEGQVCAACAGLDHPAVEEIEENGRRQEARLDDFFAARRAAGLE